MALRWVPGALLVGAALSLGGAGSSLQAPPTMDDLWDGTAYFAKWQSFPIGSPGFLRVDAGTRVVVVAHNGSSPAATWYLFGRQDSGATAHCPAVISINVRASGDEGRTWGPPTDLVVPDGTSTCMYADGSAFYAEATATWHYLVQVLHVNNTGGWELAHFSRPGPSPLGPWAANPHNPVVRGGQLFAQICAGPGKHCQPGMVDEGTPQIVEQAGADFYVTFHGYDYGRRRAARGVARTRDFVAWEVTGGDPPLPGDVIFSAADCAPWDVPWAASSGCIGSGEASVLRGPSGYLYQVIEATDVGLTCDTRWGEQWWPLGLVRSRAWTASPGWEQMARTPFVGGPGGMQPHVGCSVQYNSLHQDPASGATYFAFWDVSFFPANASSPRQTWHVYRLAWGSGHPPPMPWPGPPQRPPPPINCSTAAACRASCPGFAACPGDAAYYCCAAASGCNGTHACAANPGLRYCACPLTDH